MEVKRAEDMVKWCLKMAEKQLAMGFIISSSRLRRVVLGLWMRCAASRNGGGRQVWMSQPVQLG